jgi:hypothetical protein
MNNVPTAEKSDIKWLLAGRKKRTNTRGPKDTKLQTSVIVAENETAASAFDTGNKRIEYLLCFPNNVGVLNDPNVWIADNTAATEYMTPHRKGLANIWKAKASDLITLGNGNKENPLEIGNIVGTICDKQGNELAIGKMTNVTVLPT